MWREVFEESDGLSRLWDELVPELTLCHLSTLVMGFHGSSNWTQNSDF